MVTYEMKPGRNFMIRLPKGGDILNVIEEFCTQEDIRSAALWGIGALDKAVIGFYDGKSGEYLPITVDGPLELASCIGNVSMKDWKSHVHLHAVLSDREGRCYGGHLMPGSVIFAGEFYVRSLTGSPPERQPDAETGLSLWSKGEKS
ncbi:MAG: DNA-binding protein [Chloroflexi bacterium]|nr:DNA-binding protein [Chloroflexota bacterium]